MDYFGSIIGILGFIFGLCAYDRISKLEKKLKEKGVLDPDWKSE